MGYDLHITRRDFFADDEGPVISLEEWLAYRAIDPELAIDSENPAPENCLYAGGAEPWPLWWWRGEINTKNPPRDVIEKMVAIANALGATVQGDDGEFYPA